MRFFVSILLSIGLYSTQAMASESLISELSDQKSKRIDYLLERHKPTHVRPASCPMESKNYADILGKIKNIKNLFKDNCTNADPARLDELLNGATAIQTEIDAAQAAAGSTNQTSAIPTEVNGQQISSVVNSINSILTTGQCKFKDQSFLENTADVVTSFSQMGLLVPNSNGLIISAGGLALSSILRILDNLFTPLFDFSKNTERQTFIKLNCAFYDIRRDIESSGFMDVPSEHHAADFEEVKKLVKELDARIKGIYKEKASILEGIAKQEAASVGEGLGTLTKLGKLIAAANKSVENPIVDTDGIPATTIKLQVVQELTLMRDALVTSLKEYTERGLSKIPPMDAMLGLELSKLDYLENPEAYSELITIDNKKFNDTYRANLLFHFGRIAKDIEASKLALSKKFNEETEIEGLKIPEYIKSLEKKVAELVKSHGETLKKLKTVELRLARITKDRQYSATDDGEENIVSILSDYNEIAEQVYGEWGEKFLRYTTESSFDQNKRFEEKFDTFARNHLDKVDGQTIVPNASDLSELRLIYACQDAEPFRRAWKLGNALSQNGYDFLATNKDLFHSDTSESLMSGIHLRRSDFERIQHHYKSAMFAKKMIKGDHVSKEHREKYLVKRGGHKRYLGTVMLDVNRTKAKAVLLQELIERYNCAKVTTEE